MKSEGGRSSKGFTLVEVAVAMLIMAMVSTGIFAVLLTARTNQVQSDQRQSAIIYAQKLRDQLKNYQADYGQVADLNRVCQRMCGANCGTSACYARVTGDSGAGTCGGGSTIHAFYNTTTSFATNCWHRATGLLPTTFTSAPFSARMCYKSTPVTVSGRSVPQVDIRVEWREPAPTCP